MQLSFADGLFWSSVACCAFAQCFILRSVGARRHVRPEHSAGLPARRDTMELVWAVVPALGLVLLLLFTWRTMHPAAGTVAGSSRLSRAPVPSAEVGR
jgi:heme/copper-type cytochrome/quinol oxidase subunit 2